jgi:hypothetical protein
MRSQPIRWTLRFPSVSPHQKFDETELSWWHIFFDNIKQLIVWAGTAWRTDFTRVSYRPWTCLDLLYPSLFPMNAPEDVWNTPPLSDRQPWAVPSIVRRGLRTPTARLRLFFVSTGHPLPKKMEDFWRLTRCPKLISWSCKMFFKVSMLREEASKVFFKVSTLSRLV